MLLVKTYFYYERECFYDFSFLIDNTICRSYLRAKLNSAECFTNNFVFLNSKTTKDKRRKKKNIIVFHNCSGKTTN